VIIHREERFRMAKTNDTLRYCILGLMLRGEMTGYEIKGIFDSSLSYLWNASESQIYTTLRSLEKAGMLTSNVVFQELRPNRRVYEITEEGRKEFLSWMQIDVPDRFTKDEFLTKLYFCGDTDKKVALHHMEMHYKNLCSELDYVTEQYEKYAGYEGPQQNRVYYRLIALRYKKVTLEFSVKLMEEEMEKLRVNI
jgi:DNA-binding PadR family transcriptional regulator